MTFLQSSELHRWFPFIRPISHVENLRLREVRDFPGRTQSASVCFLELWSKSPQLGDLKQRKLILSQFWRPKVPQEVLAGLVLAAGSLQQSLPICDLECITVTSADIFTWPLPLCFCAPSSVSKDARHWIVSPLQLQGDLKILKDLHPKRLFPNKVTF